MRSAGTGSEKLTHFTREEIHEYLQDFRKSVFDDRYSISINQNRQDNMKFIEDYKITTKKEKEILLDLNVDDFCYAVRNEHPAYANEILYVFCKKHQLDNWGDLEIVEIYIKINKVESRDGELISLVVSFHPKKHPLTYLFRPV